jgi:hypothetical protein
MVIMIARIEQHQTLEAYFESLLRAALAAERLELSDACRVYLVQLTSDYGHQDALRTAEREGGESGTPALTWLYQRAVESPTRERFNAFRQLGDVALLVSGFFGPHVERSLVDVNFYVQMGGSAYSQASDLSRGSVFQDVLGQLATSFRRVVEVMTRVAEQTTMPVSRDVGSLYARWGRNPESLDLHRRLTLQGLIPARRLAVG